MPTASDFNLRLCLFGQWEQTVRRKDEETYIYIKQVRELFHVRGSARLPTCRNSYAEIMRKVGLQRGVIGSTTKHLFKWYIIPVTDPHC